MQELSLLRQIWSLLGEQRSEDYSNVVLLDIGGSNGNLACLAALLFDGLRAVIIDPDTPRAELRGEEHGF